MPFTGGDPNILSFLLTQQGELRKQKRQAELDAHKFKLDQAKADQSARKARLDNAISLATLQEKLSAQEGAVSPLLDAANNDALPNPQRQASADQAVRQINQGISNRVSLGQDEKSAAETVGKNAGAASAVKAAEVQSKFAEQISNKVGAITGKAKGVQVLGKELRDKRAALSRMNKRGEAAEALRDDIQILEQIIKGSGKEGQISITNIPGSEIPKQISALSGTKGTIERIEGLVSDIESGAIAVGPRGFVTSLGLRARGVAQEILGSPEVPQEMKSLIESAANSSGPVNVETSEGKQLSLSIDQLALAWDFVKAKRESARFTLLELETILKQLDFTSPTKTPRQVRGVLAKIYEEALRSQSRSRTILNAAGVDPSQFESGLGLTDEDRARVDSIGQFAPSPGGQASPIPGTDPPPISLDSLPPNATDEDLIRAIRGSRGAR